MTPRQRLDAILTDRLLKGFRPYGTRQDCVCFSESNSDHLAHLIRERGFAPWGIVITRKQMLDAGGGSVAYVPPDVRERFRGARLEHWAVRTEVPDSLWMHEREWRLPLREGGAGVQLRDLAAILVGNPTWRPSPVKVDGEEPEEAPDEQLPELWRTSPIWVWNSEDKCIDRHPPGILC